MIISVVAARPNFVKMAPVILEMRARGIANLVVHTGQHYDSAMSAVFFKELGMPEPDLHLDVGSGSHATQTARVMTAFEEVCLAHDPELVIVAGDVNSTLACALVAAKLQIPVAHVESGLRSNDRSMPEEINRILTDHLAELLFTTEPSANRNLGDEGVPVDRVFYVGNSMIDSLAVHATTAISRCPWQRFGLIPGHYGLVTLHRPSNVDDPATAARVASSLERVAQNLPLLFPMHPRTLSRSGHVFKDIPGLSLTEPLSYLDFIGLMARAKVVITDSGGVQEETTFLQVPCVTVRQSTERPVTIAQGTNILCGPPEIPDRVQDIEERMGSVPELWDGKAAVRIVDVVERWRRARSLQCPPDHQSNP